MTWIKLRAPNEDPALASAMKDVGAMLPPEYAASRRHERRVPPAVMRDSIVQAHSLLPDVLRDIFSAQCRLMGPGPLTRREHELIATVVSAANDCFY